jgi:hypothetical protein
MAKTLQTIVQKWRTNAGGAQTTFTEGVQNTQVDVMGRAIQAAPDAVRNFAEAITSGRWAAAINASGGTANWKARTVAKAANYGTGINAGADKFQAAMSKLLPAIEGIVGSLPPREPGNVNANIERVRALATALHARKGEFKG